MRLLLWIVLLALIFAAMVFAVSNADPVTGKGEPLYAMAYGATVAEVISRR
mgnify:CR=1 FL=1